jgi:PAS domain S-box-containing protein
MNLSRFTRNFGFRQAMLLTAGCFALIALGVMAVTVISRNYSRQGTQQTETLTRQFLPGLVTLARLQDAADNLESITYQFALAKDETAMNEQKNAFQITTVQVSRNVAKLKGLAHDEPTQRLIAAFTADMQSYRESAEKFQAELGAGEFEKAMATLDQQIGPAQEKIETQLDTLSEQYFELSDNAGTRTTALLVQSDRFGLLATIVLAGFTLLCLVLSLAATRALLVQVQKRDAERQAAQDTLEKRVEERTAALAASEERIRLIVDTASDAIITADATGMITAWNRQAEMTFGRTPAEALGRNLAETLIAPRHRDAHRQRLEYFFASGDGATLSQRIEIDALHQDGHELPVELAISPIRLGTTVIFSAFLHDITGRKRAEEELRQIHRQLVDTSRQAGMAEVATSVLHNVGNVLNSVNTSMSIATEKVSQLKAAGLGRVAALLNEHAENLPAFFAGHPPGIRLPGFLSQLAGHFSTEQKAVLGELASLRTNLDHINEIVAMQQSYAGTGGLIEVLPLAEVIDDALRMNVGAFARHGTQIVCEHDPALPPMAIDRNKLLLILVNLVRNAKYACDDGGSADKRITVRTRLNGAGLARISVSDSGVGIPSENLTRIFEHGFTTRKQGHGFGLHSSALAASEMGGSLRAHSDGPGLGATFTIDLPLCPEKP